MCVATLVDCCRGLAKSGSILGSNDLSAAIKGFGALWIIGAVGRIIKPVGMLYTSERWGRYARGGAV
jgi:hypothetical protein